MKPSRDAKTRVGGRRDLLYGVKGDAGDHCEEHHLVKNRQNGLAGDR